MRTLIVRLVGNLCCLTRHRFGCTHTLDWSLRLDDRWQTGYWTGPKAQT